MKMHGQCGAELDNGREVDDGGMRRDDESWSSFNNSSLLLLLLLMTMMMMMMMWTNNGQEGSVRAVSAVRRMRHICGERA